jgi:hypothetical protein
MGSISTSSINRNIHGGDLNPFSPNWFFWHLETGQKIGYAFLWFIVIPGFVAFIVIMGMTKGKFKFESFTTQSEPEDENKIL